MDKPGAELAAPQGVFCGSRRRAYEDTDCPSANHQMGESGKKTGLWLKEFTTPCDLFRDAGVSVKLVLAPN
jgi:hypothetical protein